MEGPKDLIPASTWNSVTQLTGGVCGGLQASEASLLTTIGKAIGRGWAVRYACSKEMSTTFFQPVFLLFWRIDGGLFIEAGVERRACLKLNEPNPGASETPREFERKRCPPSRLGYCPKTLSQRLVEKLDHRPVVGFFLLAG